MKKIFVAVFAALMCLCCAGCSSAGTISTYTMVLDAMPQNLDPQVASSPEELFIITNTFDGLFDYVDGKVVPNVCESYIVSSDGLSYTFTLRSDSSFYVNKNEQIPVTAHDFVFSFERIMNPKTLSPYYDDFSNIASVTAEMDNVLLIRLKSPDSNFLYKLCMPCATPCNREFFESTKGAYGLTVKNILSNGPYTVNYLADDGSYATLIRTYDSPDCIDRIRVSLSDGETDSKTLYESDSISGYFTDSADEGITCGNAAFNIFFNPDTYVLSNKNVRSALAYYCYGMENSGANLAALQQSYLLFPDSITYGDSIVNDLITVSAPEYMNCDNPKELLARGFAELGIVKFESLKVLVPSDMKYPALIENINQLWQKNLGVFFSLEFVPSAEIEKRVADGDFDIAFFSYTPASNSCSEILDRYSAYNTDIAVCTDAIITPGTSFEQTVSSIETAHNIITAEAFAAPMYTDSAKYVHKNYFSNIKVNPFGNIVNLKYAVVK